MEPKVKTVNTIYDVRINNESINSFDSLKLARDHVKLIPITDNIETVTIIKQTVTEQTIDAYQPKVTKVLTATDLTFDI